MLVTETSTRLQEEPTTDGAPIGSGDWELHIERLVGDPAAAVWAVDVWDTGTWGSLVWESLNDSLRGMEWTRGADQPNGRPIVGEIALTLWNNGTATTDPWVDYPNTRPGVICRAGLTSATDSRSDGWIPLWAGIVESWLPTYVGARDGHTAGDSFSTVRLVETLSWLARIDDNATGSAGSGDLISTRIDRLLTAAEWPFGMVELYSTAIGESTVPLQATTMAANRLTEVYLSADSTNSIVYSDATGAVLVADRYTDIATRLSEFSSFAGAPEFILDAAPSGDYYTTTRATLDYDPDSFIAGNDPAGVVNDHRYTRVGGSQQVFEHDVSIGAFGRSTRSRNDLIMTTDGAALQQAEYDNIREALTAIRVDAVGVTATNRPIALLCVAAADYRDNIWLFPPATATTLFAGSVVGQIRSFTHQVSPLNSGAVNWEATFALDIYHANSFPGAILLPA